MKCSLYSLRRSICAMFYTVLLLLFSCRITLCHRGKHSFIFRHCVLESGIWTVRWRRPSCRNVWDSGRLVAGLLVLLEEAAPQEVQEKWSKTKIRHKVIAKKAGCSFLAHPVSSVRQRSTLQFVYKEEEEEEKHSEFMILDTCFRLCDQKLSNTS